MRGIDEILSKGVGNLTNEDICELLKQGDKFLIKIINEITKGNGSKQFPQETRDSLNHIALTRCLKTWDNSKKVKFITYYYKVLKNEVLREITTRNRKKNLFLNSCLSLDLEYKNEKYLGGANDEVTLYNNYGSYDFYPCENIFTEIYLRPTEKQIISMLLYGYTRQEIREKLNLKPVCFSTHLSNVKNRIRKLYPNIKFKGDK